MMWKFLFIWMILVQNLQGGCLNGFIDYAIQHHPLICSENEAVYGAIARRNEIQGLFVPEVYAEGGAVNQFLDRFKDRHGYGFIGFRWNLFHGGQDVAAFNAASCEEKIRRYKVEAMALDVATNVCDAYYEMLCCAKTLKILDEAIQFLEPICGDSDRKQKAGLETPMGHCEMNYQIRMLNSRKLKACNELEAAIERLRFEMGDGCCELEIDCSGDFLFIRDINSCEDLCSIALKHHPDYAIALIEETIRQERVRMAPCELAPTVDVIATVGTAVDDVWEKKGNGARAAIVGSFPLYNGGRAENRRAYQCSEWERARLMTQQMQNRICMKVRSAVARMKAYRSQLEEMESMLQEQKKFLSEVREEYLRGIREPSDVLSALDFSLGLSLKTCEGKKDYSIAIIELANAMGDFQSIVNFVH